MTNCLVTLASSTVAFAAQQLHGSPPRATNLLAEAIEYLRPHLDRRIPAVERARGFWAIAVAVRHLGSADAAIDDLTSLSRDSGLMDDLDGGAQTVNHLIRWGLYDRNPFR